MSLRTAEERILILAPSGADASNAKTVLAAAHFVGVICGTLAEVLDEAAQGAAAILLAEEALAAPAFDDFLEMLAQQPSWSDLPVIVITTGGDTTQISARAYKAFGPAANLTLIERPFRSITLVATVRTALRSRRRQYQVRDLLEQLERKVNERTVRLQQTISDLETFSYSVSHDLRAPLRAMHGYSQALLEDYGSHLDQNAREYIRRIMANSSRLDRLVQDILTYSRTAREQLHCHQINVEKLVDDLIDQYPAFQSPNAEIVVVKPLLPLSAHEPSLMQCVSNLIGNAIKFVGPGQKPKVRIWSECEGAKVRMFFRDNGIGIEPQHYARIFKMFERLTRDGEYEGTGIGLAIVAKAVERMQGRVGVTSVIGEGSTFWIELPAA